MKRRKFRLIKGDKVFEGDMDEIINFLHHSDRIIYKYYILGRPLDGWIIEKEVRTYCLYRNGILEDTDTSVVRLMRNNGMYYTKHKRCINNLYNGSFIEIRSHYE